MMTKIILTIIVVIYLFQLQQVTGYSINKLKPEINCSKYDDDDNYIIRSFSYFIEPNPTVPNPEISYVKMNEYFKVYSLRIVNEKSVPPQIYCLKYLTKLEIENMDTDRKFPVDIEDLSPSLIELGIYNTKVTQIPNNIGRLKQLETLILLNTGLQHLSRSVGDLTSLNVLDIRFNNLTALPKIMKNLHSLTKLFLSNNSHLHSIKSLDGLPALDILNTNHCPVTRLPHNLPKLTQLRMKNNSLTSLDGIETLGNGTNTEKYFHFNENRIQYITPYIQFVVNLHVLNLERNRLGDLPTNIYFVKTLVELNIKQNLFRHQVLQKIVYEFHTEKPNATILHD